LRGSLDGKHSDEVAAAYREALFQLDWIDGEGVWYRGFARTDRRFRWVKHWTRGWDRVEPFLPREEADRFAAQVGGRLERNELVFRDPVTGEEHRVRPNTERLYPLRDLGRRPEQIEWAEVFPGWPEGRLDAAAIAKLLDTPLPKGMHPKNRLPVVRRLRRRRPSTSSWRLSAAFAPRMRGNGSASCSPLIAMRVRPRSPCRSSSSSSAGARPSPTLGRSPKTLPT
jgi:hypothetical protein